MCSYSDTVCLRHIDEAYLYEVWMMFYSEGRHLMFNLCEYVVKRHGLVIRNIDSVSNALAHAHCSFERLPCLPDETLLYPLCTSPEYVSLARELHQAIVTYSQGRHLKALGRWLGRSSIYLRHQA
jgi:hypothetical protein